jgi:cytochrome c
MRSVRRLSIGAVIALASSLLLARVHPFGDAGLDTAKFMQAPMMEHSSVPPGVRTTLIAKCTDCHSAQIRMPFYGRFVPASWLMERDILEGQKHLNFSLWESYSAEQQEAFKAKMVQETKSHDMPPLQYRMIHWNTRVSDEDVRAFTLWARGNPATEGVAVAQSSGDPLRGKEVFEKRCTGCHALTQNGEGPRLQGVYGRTSGQVAGFTYSPALRKVHVVWNDKTLERWLADPDTLVPGNNMEFHVAKPQERRDLIRFLKQ